MLHLCNDSSNLFPPVNPFNRVTSPSPASLHHGRGLLTKDAAMKTPKSRLESNNSWKARNKDHLHEYAKRRHALIMASPELLEKKRASDRKSRRKSYKKWKAYDKTRDRIKTHARSVIRNRIYAGTMVRLPCEVCGDPKSHAHHEDYSKPLEVKWLCAKHHKEIHANANH